jgi:hypothetical protein
MSLNPDIIQLILDHLYHAHINAWDEEFRADAHRAPFTRYALISKAWTLPAQIYVYRSTCIHWKGHLDSVLACLSHPERGRHIRECVRVLDIQVCANDSSTAIPLKDVPFILKLFSQIAELRLRMGPAVNALWTRASQERRLRETAVHLRGTLRAVQVSVCRNLHSDVVVKQTYELFPPSQLFFLSIATHDMDRELPIELHSNEWSTFDMDEGEYLHWPLDTSTRDTPVSSSHPIYLDTLRVHLKFFEAWLDPLITFFVPQLRQYVGPLEGWKGNNALCASQSLQTVVVPVRETIFDCWGCVVNPLRESAYVYSRKTLNAYTMEAEDNSTQRRNGRLLSPDLHVDFGQPQYRSSNGHKADCRSLEEVFMGCLDVRTDDERANDFQKGRNLYPTWPRIFLAVRKKIED